MSSGYVDVGGLQVDVLLERFLVEEALPGSATNEQSFWRGFVSLVDQFAPRNAVLLAERARLQAEIDNWHQLHSFDPLSYREFLDKIGYLAPSGPTISLSSARRRVNARPSLVTLVDRSPFIKPSQLR